MKWSQNIQMYMISTYWNAPLPFFKNVSTSFQLFLHTEIQVHVYAIFFMFIGKILNSFNFLMNLSFLRIFWFKDFSSQPPPPLQLFWFLYRADAGHTARGCSLVAIFWAWISSSTPRNDSTLTWPLGCWAAAVLYSSSKFSPVICTPILVKMSLI